MDSASTVNLRHYLGGIDIYLFDQLLKGRYDHCQTILDAGCGGGRNVGWWLHQGREVWGVDQQPEVVAALHAHLEAQWPTYPTARFVVGDLADLPFAAHTFDLVICSAVLHFADSRATFELWLDELWRVLRPGGHFFARLASSEGLADQLLPVAPEQYLLPDGSIRFVVSHQDLMEQTRRLGGLLVEPLKTTLVAELRSMSTWCMEKPVQ